MRRLAAVFAHPDDDTFGLTGTLVRLGRDVEYTVIVATSGEAGQIGDPALATEETLGSVREEEERDALAAAGLHDAVLHFLRSPDGALAAADRAELEDRVVSLLRPARPEVVVTFGPEGITRHEDHITIGEVATESFHRLRQEDPAGPAFRRLFHVALPQSRVERFWRLVAEAGLDLGDPDDPFQPRGVPDATVTLCSDVEEVVERKLAAVRAHRTQRFDLGALPDELMRQVLAAECFVQAWPPPEEGPPPAGLFDGL